MTPRTIAIQLLHDGIRACIARNCKLDDCVDGCEAWIELIEAALNDQRGQPINLALVELILGKSSDHQ